MAMLYLNADFNKNTISGSVKNLTDANGKIDNSLTSLRNGTITGNQFDAGVYGALVGTMSGNFRDDILYNEPADIISGSMTVTYGLTQYFGTFAGATD
jgi:hypothetical protein